jgi:BNR repeat-containing family member
MNEIVADAAWCWFGDPRAVYHNGRLYYGWVDSKGHIWIAQVDTATWTRRRFLIAPDTHVDDHDNPSIVIRGGRVCVFWCGHAGRSMRYRVATNSDSIDGFGPVVTCAAGNTPGRFGFTYPNVAQMAHDNALYLLWRGGNFQPTFSRSTSVTANVWSPARHLFSAPGEDRPYLKMVTDGTAWLHFMMTDGHPHNVATSLYYVGWRVVDDSFRRADGTRLASLADAPIPVSSLEKVYDGVANPRAWIWDLQLDAGLNPHAVFAVLNSREDHEYWSARHNGDWQVNRICDAGGTIAQDGERFYSGGAALDPLDLDTVAVSRPPGPQDLHRIETWRTGDGGVTWRHAATISDTQQQNVRPLYVRGAPAGMNWRLMWLRGTYGQFRDFALRLLGGEPTGAQRSATSVALTS